VKSYIGLYFLLLLRGRVNYIGMQLATQVNSAWPPPLGRRNECQRKLASKPHVALDSYPWPTVLAGS